VYQENVQDLCDWDRSGHRRIYGAESSILVNSDLVEQRNVSVGRSLFEVTYKFSENCLVISPPLTVIPASFRDMLILSLRTLDFLMALNASCFSTSTGLYPILSRTP
jgi:hypothetical protein